MSLRIAVAARVGDFHLTVDVEVAAGEVVALVGPNGAGKSTLLRLVAGLVPPASGTVHLDGRVLDDVAAGVHVPPDARGVGMVFQDHLLFPHLTALENVAFGLRARGVRADDARDRARAWLARVGLDGLGERRPAQLSGGQAQRVALARALVTDPAALLLDEPLAALDVDTRQQVRRELRRHLDDLAGPTLLVTHDPVEAITLADRLVVLEGGRVAQDASAAEVAARPRTAWIAELVGLNLFHGHAEGTAVQIAPGTALRTAEPASGPVDVVVHPRAVALHRTPPDGSPRNVLALEVDGLDVRGDHVRVVLTGAVRLVAEVTPATVAELDLGRGGTVHAAVKAVEVAVHPAG